MLCVRCEALSSRPKDRHENGNRHQANAIECSLPVAAERRRRGCECPLKEVHEELLVAGIENHPLVQKPQHAEVHVFDQGNQIVRNVVNSSERVQGHVEHQHETDEVFGSWDSQEAGADEYRRGIADFAREGAAERKEVQRFEHHRDHWLSHSVRNQAVTTAAR